MTLSDTHLILLSAAAQRDDGLLLRPSDAKGAAQRVLHKKLLKLDLVEEVPVRAGPQAWRDEAEDHFGLKITAEGLATLGIEPEPVSPPQVSSLVQPVDNPSFARSNQSRAGSKIGLVLGLVGREEGASADELRAMTGWLPHTIRAALTGLRKKGQAIELSSADGRRAYRIVPDASGRHDVVTLGRQGS